MNVPENLGYRFASWISRNRLLAGLLFGIPLVGMLVTSVKDVIVLAKETSLIAFAGPIGLGLPAVWLVLKDRDWKLNKETGVILAMLVVVFLFMSLIPAYLKR